MKNTILFLLSLYQKIVSPTIVLFVGHACRFNPTCSEYARQAIERFGVVKGGSLAIKRVLRCHPFGRPGYDPVQPDNPTKLAV